MGRDHRRTRKKKALIHAWPRSKHVREEAVQYYSSLIFEVSSFNDIYRKHIWMRAAPYLKMIRRLVAGAMWIASWIGSQTDFRGFNNNNGLAKI